MKKASVKQNWQLLNDKWVAFQAERWRKGPRTEDSETLPAPYITISREFGCYGFSLGRYLAKELNENTNNSIPWAVYNKQILKQIQQEMRVNEILVQYMDARVENAISDFFTSFQGPFQSYFYTKLFKTIHALAHQGNSIIVGRGGAILTRDIPNGFHARITAPKEWKIKSIMDMNDSTEKEAKKLYSRMKRERERYVLKYLGHDIANPKWYDLIFNCERFSMEEIAALIIEAMRTKEMIQ